MLASSWTAAWTPRPLALFMILDNASDSAVGRRPFASDGPSRCGASTGGVGQGKAPWQLGLSPAAFQDAFETEMGDVEAVRLWAMSAFDDRPHLHQPLQETRVPALWWTWLEAEVALIDPGRSLDLQIIRKLGGAR